MQGATPRRGVRENNGGATPDIHCAAASACSCAGVKWTAIFLHHISAFLSYPVPHLRIILATPAEMLTLTAAPTLPQAAAVSAVVAVLGVAVRRRYFSPISDIPGPFWGSFSLLWQLHKIFTKHTERATICAHKRWGAS